MTLGGKFKKEHDWHYNVDTDGFFLDNKDIYNISKIILRIQLLGEYL